MRVHFTNRYGGTADLDLEHLDLRGFRSWEPDQPGVFVLTANVNGVEVNAYGTARPFAEKITAAVEVGVDGAGLQNIEQYTGPFDFKRRDGTLTVYARNDLELFPDGRLNGTTDATLVFGNVDVADPSRGEVKLDQCGVTADARYGIDEAGVTTVGGKAEVKLNQADARLANGMGVALPFATLGLADLSATLPGDGAVRLKTTAKASAENGNLTVGGGSPGAPPVAMSFAGISTQATDLTLTSSADGTRLAAKATAGAQQLAVLLSQPAGGGEARRIAADTVGIELPSMSLEMASGASSITGAGTGRLSKVSVALPASGDQPRVDLAADGGRLDFTDLELNSGGDGEMRLDGTLQAALTGLAGSWGSATAGPVEQPRRGRTVKPAEAAAPVAAAGRISVNDLAFGFAPLRLRATRDGVAAGGLVSTTVTGLNATVPAAAGAAPYDVAAARFRLDLADLDLASRGAESTLSAKLDTTADGLVATQAESSNTASDARGTSDPTGGGQPARRPSRHSISSSRADQFSVSTAGSTALDRLTAALPKTATKPAFDVRVGGVRANIAEVGAELASGAARWRARLDAQLADIASLVDGGKLASSKVRTLSIGDARADDRLRFAVDRIVLDKPEASLTSEYVAATAASRGEPAEGGGRGSGTGRPARRHLRDEQLQRGRWRHAALPRRVGHPERELRPRRQGLAGAEPGYRRPPPADADPLGRHHQPVHRGGDQRLGRAVRQGARLRSEGERPAPRTAAAVALRGAGDRVERRGRPAERRCLGRSRRRQARWRAGSHLARPRVQPAVEGRCRASVGFGGRADRDRRGSPAGR